MISEERRQLRVRRRRLQPGRHARGAQRLVPGRRRSARVVCFAFAAALRRRRRRPRLRLHGLRCTRRSAASRSRRRARRRGVPHAECYLRPVRAGARGGLARGYVRLCCRPRERPRRPTARSGSRRARRGRLPRRRAFPAATEGGAAVIVQPRVPGLYRVCHALETVGLSLVEQEDLHAAAKHDSLDDAVTSVSPRAARQQAHPRDRAVPRRPRPPRRVRRAATRAATRPTR